MDPDVEVDDILVYTNCEDEGIEFYFAPSNPLYRLQRLTEGEDIVPLQEMPAKLKKEVEEC
jgi:hypothetical protein